ncbi:hypothetical protein BS17DRAFT_806333 [Gyrodon lividus]|nr:hypothetical protein BS17DRAFT_806333 [Gyrodon lividus]
MPPLKLSTPHGNPETQALITMMEQIRICNYVTISALAFTLYDIVTNLDKEIDLVWKYRRNDGNDPHVLTYIKVLHIFVQVLFIFGRYYGLVFLTVVFAVNNATGLSISVCKLYYYYVILAGAVLYGPTVNFILAVRLDAMYRFPNGAPNSGFRKLLTCLVIGDFLVEFTICVIIALRTAAEVVRPSPWVSWPGCILSSEMTPSLTLVSWLTALLVSTIFCAMTLNRVFREKEFKFSLKEMKTMQPTLTIVVRDGVSFYFLIFAILLVSTVILAVVQNEFAALPMSFLIEIYSYCVSRLILNLRDANNRICPEDGPDGPDAVLPLVTFAPAPQGSQA